MSRSAYKNAHQKPTLDSDNQDNDLKHPPIEENMDIADLSRTANPLSGFNFEEADKLPTMDSSSTNDSASLTDGSNFKYIGQGEVAIQGNPYAYHPTIESDAIQEVINSPSIPQNDNPSNTDIENAEGNSLPNNELVAEDIESDSLAIFDSAIDLGVINPVTSEALDLDTMLNNFLSISPEDVLIISDSHHLTIDGDVTDIVNLEGTWVQTDVTDGYTNYTSGEASISIDNSIVDAGGVNIS